MRGMARGDQLRGKIKWRERCGMWGGWRGRKKRRWCEREKKLGGKNKWVGRDREGGREKRDGREGEKGQEKGRVEGEMG